MHDYHPQTAMANIRLSTLGLATAVGLLALVLLAQLVVTTTKNNVGRVFKDGCHHTLQLRKFATTALTPTPKSWSQMVGGSSGPSDDPVAIRKFMGAHAAAAYVVFCTPSTLRTAAWLPDGWRLVRSLRTLSDTIDGYILMCAETRTLLICFRGTNDVEDVAADFHFDFLPVPWIQKQVPKAAAHDGISRRYLNLRSQVWDAVAAETRGFDTVLITGHSLGAGTGVLAAIDLTTVGVDVRTLVFAPPKVLNAPLAQYAHDTLGSKLLLAVNSADAVPVMPPSAGFFHGSQHVLSFFDDNGSWAKNHHMGRVYLDTTSPVTLVTRSTHLT